jgi:curved DNA-binding protein CbpA
MPDYYKILGVARSATVKEIKVAFRKSALKCHPDVSPGKDSAEQFQKLTIAYETLSDKKLKLRYDSELVHAGGAGGGGGFRPWHPDDQRPGWRGNRPPTAYNPAGFSQRARPTATVDAKKFNMKEWEAMHYGEESEDGGREFGQGNVRNKTWMDMKQGAESNSHQDYFRNKMRQKRERARAESVYGADFDKPGGSGGAGGPSAEQAAEKLASAREARRAATAAAAKKGDPKKKGTDECSIM